ncbi:hypothetical protein [Aeromonas schubertii]|uniref:hypothetical protein n=1 Tax=Aeromonas schubertii TaxID=652 RepID=UPI001CC7CF41|nr:hypothetical protein [Aeromonas schubertii]MBZ6072383.1 hypothetical protein [Aeromonas schubertii]
MKLKDILLKKLDSMLNPKLENRIIGTLLTLGSLLIGVPSVMAYSAVLSVQNGNTTFTAEISNGPDLMLVLLGVICLSVSVYLFVKKQQRENSVNQSKPSEEDVKDRATLMLVLDSINTHELDEGIDRGHLSQFYGPVLHYFYGVEAIAKSSSFVIYDKTLSTLFREFYQSFDAFCSHGVHFRPSSHPNLHRFVKAHEIGDWRKCEEYENSYLADVAQFESNYHKLINHIKHNFSDIDLRETNKTAFEDYKRYNQPLG